MGNNILGPAVELQEAYSTAQISFHAAFFNYLEKMDEAALKQIAMEVPSDTALEQHIFMGDVPGFAEWVGDREMGALMAHAIKIANKNWSSGISIHRNQIADDKLGLVWPAIQGLAKKAKHHPAKLLAELFMNGFTGTSFPEVGDGTSYDGALFFSAAHALEGGPAQSNLLVNVALGDSGLEQAYQLFRQFTTYDGLDPLEVEPTHLLVGPKLEWMAKRLVGQQLRVRNPGDTGTTFQTGADTNVHYGSLQVIVSQRLRNYPTVGSVPGGDFSTAWGLLALGEPIKPYLFQDREPITAASQVTWDTPDMFKRGQMNFGAQARYNVANYDWRLAVGSRGA